MLSLADLRFMHRHGDDWETFGPREPHDSAELDPERAWVEGARVLRCPRCEAEVTVSPGNIDELATERGYGSAGSKPGQVER